MKIEVTQKQIDAIINLKEDAKSMIGVGGETDELWNNYIAQIDKMLSINGLDKK